MSTHLGTGWIAIACLALAACGAPKAEPPLKGAAIGGPFALTDQNGKRVTDRDFDGKYRLVYFGYAYCPDVCPTDMAKLTTALKSLEASDPALAAKLAPIFITVDPERDTPAVLKQFAANFHPRLVALTGSPAEIDKTASAFKIYRRKQEPGAGGGYLVDHSANIYIMDPRGAPLDFLSHDMKPDQMAATIRKWAK